MGSLGLIRSASESRLAFRLLPFRKKRQRERHELLGVVAIGLGGFACIAEGRHVQIGNELFLVALELGVSQARNRRSSSLGDIPRASLTTAEVGSPLPQRGNMLTILGNPTPAP